MRISDNAKTCAMSFGQSFLPDSPIKFCGTGFIASLSHAGVHSQYLVTCGHIARRLEGGWIGIRTNLKAGGANFIPIDYTRFVYHADQTVDLAAMPFDLVDSLDHAAYPVETQPQHPRDKAQCGDPINIVGVFRLQVGTNRTTPIIHNGHVAVQPDPDHKIPVLNRNTGKKIDVETYLVEAHTFRSLAGSPVFYHSPALRRDLDIPDLSGWAEQGREHLLGLYAGEWNGESGELLAKDENWKGNQRVPQSMGLVIPVEKIVELLVEPPAFKAHRDTRTAQHQTESAS